MCTVDTDLFNGKWTRHLLTWLKISFSRTFHVEKRFEHLATEENISFWILVQIVLVQMETLPMIDNKKVNIRNTKRNTNL